jgi:glutamate dehydrogenase
LPIEPGLDELIKSHLPSDQARRLRLFAERLFAREPYDLKQHLSGQRRFELARSALEFLSLRRGTVEARVTLAADKSGATIVETVTPDCPFIVDSLLECFDALGAPVRAILHPILRVGRDAGGRLVSLEAASAQERPESFVHAELEIAFTPERASLIVRQIREVLGEVHQATGDFERMTEQAHKICEETAPMRELVEVRDFLRWLVQGGFVFLGYRRYRVEKRDGARAAVPQAESGLGILAEYEGSRFKPPSPLDEFTPGELKLLFEGPALVTAKVGVESHVHRRRPMDSVMIRRAGASGRVEAFDRFIGLYTSKAYAESAQHIPLLRAKLGEVLRTEGAIAGSHDYKAIVAAFNSLPKEELFRASVEEIRRQLKLILDLKSESTVRLSLLSDPNRGQVIALVVMPREAFSPEVRLEIERILERRLAGKLIYYHLALGEERTARLHLCFAAPAPPSTLYAELEPEIARLARTWEDQLREYLGHRLGPARAHEILARWGLAYTAEYKAVTRVERAFADIEKIEALLAGAAFAAELNPATADGKEASELRMLELGEAPVLSELMPMLQNFGIRVLSEDAHQFSLMAEGGVARACAQSFLVQAAADGQPLHKLAGAALIPEAVAAVRAGRAEDDPLNALTPRAALSWREVALVRSYLAAGFQMRLGPARPAVRRVFLAHPELARVLVDLFAARLGPGAQPKKAERLRSRYLGLLGEVENIADDRIARAVLSMVEATVRTNYFVAAPEPAAYIALKFESTRILGLPDPAPLYEIHVNSPQMEGCHLRAGRVARGGIRFSDRPDDYRTEILGLMKTQIVKNAVIVPTGAKGGFIVKPHAGRAAAPDEAVEAYRTLIDAMLDLTDNLTDQGAVHPPEVKVLDNDGPYLVVAADKGTATFSDTANAIATARGFWLGDAFASGGEHGYDHKQMGITARGAWESARQHLREMGRDPIRGAPVTMVGIGDMSGDVFGNGLLYSRNIRLIAAFDHRHIFVDPDPDPASSYEERRRLFNLARSSWADYQPSLISKGGGVFRRGLKRIELSPEARAALGCDAEALDSESLIRAVLRAPVDLLYNGGIGTYVRASGESDAEVGDHANDSCRIAAGELRAKVVVEGGNMGLTQKARIEYALAGGRINTDAIDNSAGVDTSDHEVNLKILLEPAVRRAALSFDERNRVLAGCTDEIAERVLGDNRDQVLSLSLEQARSRIQTNIFHDHMQALEGRGPLRRYEETLPGREVLGDRRARYPGLTRPELAVITAYTKIDLAARLENSAFVDDHYLVDRFLKPYFPPSVAAPFAEDIGRHRLRREIAATRIVNRLVDLMGSSFVFGMARDHGVEAHEAIRAWIIGADIIDLQARAERLRARGPAMTAEAEVNAFLALERAAADASAWALTGCDPTAAIGAVVGRFGPAFAELSGGFESALDAGERERFERSYRELRARVNEEELAHMLARLGFTGHLMRVLDLSFARGIEISRAVRAYFGLSRMIDFATVEGALLGFVTEDQWERRTTHELLEALGKARCALCCSALKDETGAESMLRRLQDGHARRFNEVERLMAEVRAMPSPSLAALYVTVGAIAKLADGA